MLPYTNKTTEPHLQPKPKGSICRWKLPKDFNENIGLGCLGKLQELLQNDNIKQCEIDFAEVIWADPQPLLCLGLVLAESRLTKNHITIDLGNKRVSNREHLIFLKFFSNQGFLNEFSDHAQFLLNGSTVDNISLLQLDLAHEDLPTHFFNADCILAKILKVNQFKNDAISLQRLVEEIFQEAKDRSSQTAFASNPFTRDILFQKIRKLLYELLLNVAEHSHPEGLLSYAGIYARVRAAKPPIHRNASAWITLYERKTIPICGQKTFTPNHYTEWLELFICDVGLGLTHHIKKWTVPKDNPEVAKILKQAQTKVNPFKSIVSQLFQIPFSRHKRHTAERTAVTGLQHLGHLLSRDRDHCRIYTQKGCWAGDHFPWKNLEHSFDDINSLSSKENRFTPVSGTAYAFSIQPDHRILTDDPPWELLKEEGRIKIVSALRKQTVVDETNVKIAWFDRRGINSCPIPEIDEFPSHDLDVIVLRPPRLVSKLDIAKWLDLVVGLPHDYAKKSTKIMILAGLTPFQTLIFHELLKHNKVSQHTQLDWYLVSEQWAVSCLSTKYGKQIFEASQNKARKFLDISSGNTIFTIADLAILLRQMDSVEFWRQESDSGRTPFFNYPVEWEGTYQEGNDIKLSRYLDFPLALVEPNRYRACLRSLRRSLALFPRHLPVGADDLVTSLVREATMTLYNQNNNGELPKVLVGSIAVTGKTIDDLLPGSETEYLHILDHKEVQKKTHFTSFSTLLWISDLPAYVPPPDPPPEYKAWKRIPHTPYIAPLGEKSISVLRYKPNQDDGSLDFDKPYYERTPEDTYNDFNRLGVLKTGHWRYGSRHDLQTINMRLAFRFSFREKGPLYDWLIEKFTDFFHKDKQKQMSLFTSPTTTKTLAKAQFLLYPSHPVTDTLLDRIRQEEEFQHILPEGGMIPIKFVGKRTVSPLIASHLVKNRIIQVLRKKRWEYQKWKAVIFDDGTISGKHLRETTQFLQALGASYVFLIAVLDRSGLPVQEEVYQGFFKKHKRFWRWDVPGLGSMRNCSLCQALAIIKTYSQHYLTERQKNRLASWIKIWKVRDVDMDWYQSGLQPTSLDPPLPITFGIDPIKSAADKPIEKQIFFNSSTAATSLLMELTRLTTRTDVALKKGGQVLKDSPLAAIEMIATQLFLYMDELSPKEKLERFKKLFDWAWERKQESDITSLAGLCLALIEDELIEDIWFHCVKLLEDRIMGNLDTILSVSILCSKYEFSTGNKYKVSGDLDKVVVQNYLLLNREMDLPEHIKSLLTLLISNPDNPCQAKSHRTEIKKRLDELCNKSFEEDGGIVKKVCRITDDLNLICETISRLQKEYVIDLTDKCQLLTELEKEFQGFQNKSVETIKQMGWNLRELLYGSDRTNLIETIQKELFLFVKDPDSLNTSFIPPFTRYLHKQWEKIINDKIEQSISDKHDPSDWNELECWLKKSNDGKTKIIQNKPKWNGNKPVMCFSESDVSGGIWCYCDHFFKKVLFDILTNVTHASGMIIDPFKKEAEDSMSAHLWYCFKMENPFLIFKAANASMNKEITLKQRVPIACIERLGGKLNIWTEETKETSSPFIAYTELYLPLFQYFLGEKK